MPILFTEVVDGGYSVVIEAAFDASTPPLFHDHVFSSESKAVSLAIKITAHLKNGGDIDHSHWTL